MTFFRAALLVPLVAPFLLFPFGQGAIFALLALSLGFGGIQYLCFAAALFFVVGRLGSASKIKSLSLWLPALFVPVQALGWLIYAKFSQGSTGTFADLLPGAIYSLILGYVYVALSLLGYRAFVELGWIDNGEVVP